MLVRSFLKDMGYRFFLALIGSGLFLLVLFLVSNLFDRKQVSLVAFVFLIIFFFNLCFVLFFEREKYFKASLFFGVFLNAVILLVIGCDLVDFIIVTCTFMVVSFLVRKCLYSERFISLVSDLLKMLLLGFLLAIVLIGLIVVWNLTSFGLDSYCELSLFQALTVIVSFFVSFFTFILLLSLIFIPSSLFLLSKSDKKLALKLWIFFIGTSLFVATFEVSPFYKIFEDLADPCYNKIGSKGPEYKILNNRVCVSNGSVTRTFKGVDFETFKELNYGFSKDQNNVYYGSSRLEADPATFLTLKQYGFAKDLDNVFYFGEKIDVISPSKLEFVGEDYLWDGQNCIQKGGRDFKVVESELCVKKTAH